MTPMDFFNMIQVHYFGLPLGGWILFGLFLVPFVTTAMVGRTLR